MIKYKNTGNHNYMWTYSGNKIFLDKINIDEIHLKDIAVGLSRICRFACQTKYWYSVATHSVFVAEQCPDELKLPALFHDGPEFLLGDLCRVIKYMPQIYKVYKPLEHKLMKGIAKKFNFSFTAKISKQISKLEYPVFLAEVRDLIKLPNNENIDLSKAANIDLTKEYSISESENMFIEYYNKLIKCKK